MKKSTNVTKAANLFYKKQENGTLKRGDKKRISEKYGVSTQSIDNRLKTMGVKNEEKLIKKTARKNIIWTVGGLDEIIRKNLEKNIKSFSVELEGITITGTFE